MRPSRRREIKDALWGELNKPCDVPGFEHMTQFEFGIRMLVHEFMGGSRWATKVIFERLFGRVPVNVAVTESGLEHLTDEELVAHLDELKAVLALPEPNVSEPDKPPAEQGAAPVRVKPYDG